MRRILQRHRWLTLGVVGLLLFATSGLMLSRMTCLMSGRSVVAIGMVEDCCPEQEQPEGASLAPVCCVYAQAAADVEPFRAHEDGGSVQVPYVQCGSLLFADLFVQQDISAAVISDRAPPLLGQRLALLATFRI
ncbi:MAG: hypothetical protein KF905_10515 [Flavobacteriales bacterium]|nr:hypothetical protein [Flavobacteriales bacterium]